jgi:hypothetical protein
MGYERQVQTWACAAGHAFYRRLERQGFTACSRGTRSPDSRFSNITDMEFVFRVKLDLRHRFISRGIKGRQLRFWRVEFSEVTAGVAQAQVVGVGRPIAPSLPVGLSGDGNGGLVAALVTFKLCLDVERVGVHERIRPALGGGPDLVEEFACGVVILLLPGKFGKGHQRGQFFFDDIAGAGTGEGMVQVLGRGGQVA